MSDSLKCKLPLVRKDGLVVQPLKKETLIYDLKRHRAHCLNAAATLIWQKCDGKATVAAVITHLEKHLNIPVSEDIIWQTLEQFGKAQLLEAAPVTEKHLSSLTRRAMIKQAGKAAAVTLPMVMSILAPTAAQAASCRVRGTICTSNGQCCSGKCLNTGGTTRCR